MSDVIDEIVDNKEKLVETTLENINKINKILMIVNQDYIDDSKKIINYVKEISQLYSKQELAPEQDEVAPAAPTGTHADGEADFKKGTIKPVPPKPRIISEDTGEEELESRSTLIETNPTQIEPRLNLLRPK